MTESAETVLPPLFLSIDALGRAKQIHADLVRPDAVVRDRIDGAVSQLVDSTWSDFDGVYLALYTLSLWGPGREIRLPHAGDVTGGDFHREGVQFMLDFELRNRRNEFGLLDERVVATVINFRHAIGRLIPFRVIPAVIGFGCVYLGFDVFFPASSPPRDTSPRNGVPPPDHGVLRRYVNGPQWQRIADRFHVTGVAFDQ